MSSLYDMDEPLPSQEERNAAMEAAIQEAERIWRGRKRWALYITGAFGLDCAVLLLFFEGFPLHAYAEPSASILLDIAGVLLVPFVVCLALLWPARQLVRNVKRRAREVKEEGY